MTTRFEISVEVAEALVHPVRVGKEREARRLIGTLEIVIDPIDERIAVTAAKLRAEHGGALRMADALLLACAEARKAKSVLAADVRWTLWSRRGSRASAPEPLVEGVGET